MLCRGCQIGELTSVLPLGKMPLANQLLKKADLHKTQEKYNLEVMLCSTCGLVQLKDLVSPQTLFNEYLYFSSSSETMVQSAAQLVDELSQQLSKNSQVIEIASNDGYLLQHYRKKNIPILGIEPAANIATVANAQNIPTRCEFFNHHLAEKLVQEGISADVIHANNVLAHVPNINGFILGVKTLLKPTGIAIIEVPYLLDLITNCEFDTIYHEHIYYFALTPLIQLFEKQGLKISDVEKIPMHGGSLRLFIEHVGKAKIQPNVESLLLYEKEINIHQPTLFNTMIERIHHLKIKLLKLLRTLKINGSKIAAYGASAKGATLLNYFGIDHTLIDFVVDRNSAKQNLYMPGVQLPIYAPEALNEHQPDYALLLTWNFADEILKQQSHYRSNGGKFIIPIPELKIQP